MADATRTRVRLSLRSSLAIVLGLGATILFLEILRDAQRVIAWVLCASAVAALVTPLVNALERYKYVPRGLAVAITVLLGLGAIGFLGYRVANDVSNAMDALQEAAPDRAHELERDSDFFREIKLEERVTRFVDAIPERLAGGDTAEALRSAATRGVAFLAGIILTVFFILYGPRLLEGALSQVEDEHSRHRLRHILGSGSRRALYFSRVKIWEAVVEGFIAYSIARMANIPGAAALAVWVALWSIVPVAGVFIGALPFVVFAAAISVERAVAVGIAFVAIALADFAVNRWLERNVVDVGSFAIVLAAFAGLELYGLTGALLFVLGAVFFVSILSEVEPEELADTLASTDAVP
jgi:putative heme transporter